MLKKRSELKPYQNDAIKLVYDNMKYALYLHMGMGKSVISLTALSDLFDDFAIKKALVITTLATANNVWKQECAKWEHLKHLKIEIATGSHKKRLEVLSSEADIHVTNVDNVPKMCEHFLKSWRWDAIIFDESTRFKNHDSERFKAIKKVVPILKCAVLLSGTPTPKCISDLWSQMYLLDMGKRLGKNITAFRSRFMSMTPYCKHSWMPRMGAKNEVMKLVSDITVTYDNPIELPGTVDEYIRFDLPQKAREVYDKLKNELVAVINGETLYEVKKTSDVVDVRSQGVLFNKLSQICNGFIYDYDKNITKLHDEKLKILEKLYEEGENLLVAYAYKPDLDAILEKFPDARILDKTAVQDWNAGKIRMLVVHPMSAGHGLTLSEGGHVCVWYGLPWSLECYEQMNARLNRRGQTEVVRIVHIMTHKDLDNKILSGLRRKFTNQHQLIEYFKASITDPDHQE